MTTLSKIQKLAKQELNIDLNDLALDTRFDVLGVDSLELIEFLFVLENELHIQLPDDRKSMQTIGNLVETVEAAAAVNSNQAG
jgi:acyl carrier protein